MTLRSSLSGDDISYMKHALALAEQGLGRVAPNPSVGCVLVKNGAIIGEGRTADGGRPHAEVVALEMAGVQAQGATAYVTLEPCAHHGETPPCAQALVDADVSRVLIACHDPDPRVSGRGVQILREAGIDVVEGVCETEALTLNAGFFLRVTEDRPFVTLKMAVSADGMIAAKHGARTQISGAEAFTYVHKMRAQHDAILVGMGTVLADDPLLTSRAPNVNHKMTRIVLGMESRMPCDSKLIQSRDEHPLIVLVEHEPRKVLHELAQRGITRLMVEGGATVMQAFLEAGVWDEFHLIRASQILGGDAVSVDLSALTQPIFEKRILGEDVLEIYKKGA